MSKGIRGYGPGKFNTILDSVIYDMIGQGMGHESCGDVSEVGFFAESILLDDADALKDVEKAADESGDSPLTEEEKELIEGSYAAIMTENEQGFVAVDYYETKEEFESDWKEIQEEASGEGDEEEEGEEGDEEEEEEGEEEEGDGEAA